MAFALFLLVNAVLFTRPAEVIEPLQALPIYYVVMSACLLVSLPAMLDALVARHAYSHPAFVCMAAFCVLSALSLFVNAKSLDNLTEESIELFKTLLYLVVFLAVVDRPSRLRTLIVFLVAFGMFLTAIALLNYFDIVKFSTITAVAENDEADPSMQFFRLRFSGILQDPNEACVFLSILTIYSCHGLTDRASGLLRILWLLPLAMFLPAIALTHSRGGLLALIAGLVVYWIYSFGGRKGLAMAMLGVPVVLVAFAGRQTSFSGAATGQTRVGLWSDWMDDFRQNPILGVGPRVKGAGEVVGAPASAPEEKAKPEEKHAAHNSYLQAFADTGFLGGIVFLGAFCFAFTSMQPYAFHRVRIEDATLRRLHPCIMGATAVYAVGMLSLTLNYIITTFFALAVPIAFVGMTQTTPPIRREGLTPETATRIALVGIGFLAFTYVVIRLFRNY